MTTKRLIDEVKWVLYSLDEGRIRRFAKSWGIEMPSGDVDFWRSVYKSILEIPDSPRGLKVIAMNWLDKYSREEIKS